MYVERHDRILGIVLSVESSPKGQVKVSVSLAISCNA